MFQQESDLVMFKKKWRYLKWLKKIWLKSIMFTSERDSDSEKVPLMKQTNTQVVKDKWVFSYSASSWLWKVCRKMGIVGPRRVLSKADTCWYRAHGDEGKEFKEGVDQMVSRWTRGRMAGWSTGADPGERPKEGSSQIVAGSRRRSRVQVRKPVRLNRKFQPGMFGLQVLKYQGPHHQTRPATGG